MLIGVSPPSSLQVVYIRTFLGNIQPQNPDLNFDYYYTRIYLTTEGGQRLTLVAAGSPEPSTSHRTGRYYGKAPAVFEIIHVPTIRKKHWYRSPAVTILTTPRNHYIYYRLYTKDATVNPV
ncbi:hypothetical protein PILCRDRAFT_743859 [Piloderma croceum F 1598]|uniref:Uncharacterized protein n=1 Tax=Piloderma croceum (strain F 1598) TaxID=765440 RepID=A0A0C3B4K8_PILCF|nr:hypothetical protein PILCRDRAFT_743859 [Piloderma croceum F 1598]